MYVYITQPVWLQQNSHCYNTHTVTHNCTATSGTVQVRRAAWLPEASETKVWQKKEYFEWKKKKFTFCAWCSWIRASWYNYEVTKKMQLCRLIYYPWSALHVSSEIFTHYQEHLTVFTVSGSIHPSSCRLVSWMSWNWTQLIQETSQQVSAGWCLGWVQFSFNSSKTPACSYLGEYYQIL